ncbi:MAG: CPBP family intramembrane metalloprotease [Alphaproteobacteria bacterium]|nr:CPBP family intramembrane metalloprotease [Alphaproteobacteria bacterium]
MMMKAAISTGKIVLYFVLMGLVVAGLMEFVVPAVAAQLGGVSTVPRIVTLGAINFIAMSLPAMALTMLFDGKSPVAMGFGRTGGLSDFLMGGVVGGFIFLSAVAAAVFGGWASINPDFATFSMRAMAWSMAGMTLAAAGEEVMMRGFVLQELMSKFSVPASVIVSSLIFMALHGAALVKSDMAAVGALNIFLASVLMSLAYLATRTLWLPIGIHAGWNIMQGPMLGFNVSGNDFNAGWQPVTMSGPEMMTGGTFGFEASVLGLIGPVLGILMMLLFRQRSYQ